MPHKEYDQLLLETVDNALLHLYMAVAKATQFMPKKTRNERVVKWLKPKLTHSKYKLIKKEIKSLIQIGRHAKGDLERRLIELKSLSERVHHEMDDVSRIYDLLNRLYDKHGIHSYLTDDHDTKKNDTLYLSKQDIIECFSDDNKQIAPLSAFIVTLKVDEIAKMINDTGLMKASIKEFNDETMIAHFQLNAIHCPEA